jgi:exoribonuclease R
MDEIIENEELVIIDNNTQENAETINIDHPYLKYNELAGILYLDKTFGKKGCKYLYKCKPYDKMLPCLLVPYDNNIGFQKNVVNKYILFKFENVNAKPMTGSLLRTLGNIDSSDEEDYFEYLYYGNCLQINQSLLKRQIRTYINANLNAQQVLYDHYKTKQICYDYVFTIDGADCVERDDAFCMQKIDEGYKVRVCITNVHVWLETMGLWDYLSNEIKTVYLPHMRKPMLPSIFLDNFCNFTKDNYRIASCYTFIINESGAVVRFYYENMIIKINKNFIYEETELLKDRNYNYLLNLTRMMDKGVENSYDVVKYWMVLVNQYAAKEFISSKRRGIYLKYFEKTYEQMKSERGQPFYVLENDSGYLQVTSPMRRMGDLLNALVKDVVHGGFNGGHRYMEKWLENLDEKNEKIRYMKHVEKKSEMIHLLRREENNEKEFVVHKVYDGIYKINELQRFVFSEGEIFSVKFRENNGKIIEM